MVPLRSKRPLYFPLFMGRMLAAELAEFLQLKLRTITHFALGEVIPLLAFAAFQPKFLSHVLPRMAFRQPIKCE